jgi:WD40 repeat protein
VDGAEGGCLESPSGDGTVRLWDAHMGTAVLRLMGHTDVVRTAYFSPDGTRIVSGSDDGTVRIWDARPFSRIQSERAAAEAVSTPSR